MQANKQNDTSTLYWKVQTIFDPGTTTDENGKTVRIARINVASFITSATKTQMQEYLRKQAMGYRLKYGCKGDLDEVDNTDDDFNPALFAQYGNELDENMEFTTGVTLVADILEFKSIIDPGPTLADAFEQVSRYADALDDEDREALKYSDIKQGAVNLQDGLIPAAETTDWLKETAAYNRTRADEEYEETLAGLDDYHADVTEHEELDAMGRSGPDYWTNEAGEYRCG